MNSSSQNELVSPDRNVKVENQMMVICSTRTRPMRSDSMPASHPPSADMTSTAVPRMPASPVDMCHNAMRVGMVSAYICVSSASSAHPLKHAKKVRRSSRDSSEYQLNAPAETGRCAGCRCRGRRNLIDYAPQADVVAAEPSG